MALALAENLWADTVSAFPISPSPRILTGRFFRASRRTCSVSGLTSSHNMTGWRCGWAVARPEVATNLAKVKSFVDTGQFMAVQAAGVAALESYDSFLPGNLAIFKERRDAAVTAFRAAGFACETPLATMYLWIKLPDGVPSAAFAERLLEDEGVIVMSGSSFGAGGEGFFRISFITSPARIAEAAVRAGRVLANMMVGAA